MQPSNIVIGDPPLPSNVAARRNMRSALNNTLGNRFQNATHRFFGQHGGKQNSVVASTPPRNPLMPCPWTALTRSLLTLWPSVHGFSCFVAASRANRNAPANKNLGPAMPSQPKCSAITPTNASGRTRRAPPGIGRGSPSWRSRGPRPLRPCTTPLDLAPALRRGSVPLPTAAHAGLSRPAR